MAYFSFLSLEMQLIRLLRVTYQQHVRHVINVLPPEVSGEILEGE